MAKIKKEVKSSRTVESAIDYQQPIVRKDASSMYNQVLVGLLLVASFFLGRLSLEVSTLKSAKMAPNTVQEVAGGQQQAGRKLDIPSLKALAKDLGVDSSKFDACLDGGTYADKVAAEVTEGQGLGVSGTPSFFINGIMLVGAQPQSAFEAIIDAELKNGTGDAEAKKLGEDGIRKTLAYGTGYVKGEKNAKIKIIEFTDFECPFCERAFPTVEAVLEKYKGKISLEYRSFPLPFHPLAQKAAEAALCAGELGKFWEMHDSMFAPAK